MSNPIEEATLALYAADDALRAATDCISGHACLDSDYRPCSTCGAAFRDAQGSQFGAETALLRVVRDARPRS